MGATDCNKNEKDTHKSPKSVRYGLRGDPKAAAWIHGGETFPR